MDPAILPVSLAVVSVDRRKVYLEIDGLRENHVVYIKLTGLISASGESPWGGETWYTLNSISQSEAFDINGCMDINFVEYDSNATYHIGGYCQTVAVDSEKLTSHIIPDRTITVKLKGAESITVIVPIVGRYKMRISDIRGKTVVQQQGSGLQQWSFPVRLWMPGVYFIEAWNSTEKIQKRMALP